MMVVSPRASCKGNVYPHTPVKRTTVELLADRLLRKHMLTQFVDPAHPVLQEELRLVSKSVNELYPQTRKLLPLQMAVLYAYTMERAEWSLEQLDEDGVDPEAVLDGVEEDLFALLSKLTVFDC